MLKIDPRDAVPIWKQIENEIRRLVAVGKLAPGNAVPSVRELAQELRVNPATIQKAYQRLCDEGLLAVKRGEGTFVSEKPPAMRKADRREALAPAALRFATLAATLGASRDEAIAEVDAAFERLGGTTRRER